MFSSNLKSLTPRSSKSTSPVPPEFEVDDQIENYINDPCNDPERNGNDQEADVLQAAVLDGDTTLNSGIHYEYTNNHPLGKLLLKVLRDNTQLPKKT